MSQISFVRFFTVLAALFVCFWGVFCSCKQNFVIFRSAFGITTCYWFEVTLNIMEHCKQQRSPKNKAGVHQNYFLTELCTQKKKKEKKSSTAGTFDSLWNRICFTFPLIHVNQQLPRDHPLQTTVSWFLGCLFVGGYYHCTTLTTSGIPVYFYMSSLKPNHLCSWVI